MEEECIYGTYMLGLWFFTLSLYMFEHVPILWHVMDI